MITLHFWQPCPWERKWCVCGVAIYRCALKDGVNLRRTHMPRAFWNTCMYVCRFQYIYTRQKKKDNSNLVDVVDGG